MTSPTDTEVARLRGIIRKLVEAGAGCSNMCHNLSQVVGHTLTERECESMRKAYKNWDAATKHARSEKNAPGPDGWAP